MKARRMQTSWAASCMKNESDVHVCISLLVKYLPSAFLSFEFRGYVESATELVFDNTIHNLKGIDITYKTTLHMISLDIAFNSYRRVNMEFTNAEIRAILKFSFVKGKSARETFREINGVLGDGTLSLRTAEEWFRRFRAGENDTMDKPAGGRPVTTNTDQIMEYIELDRHVASRDIAQEVGVSHQTILNHLQKAGYKKSLMFGCHTN